MVQCHPIIKSITIFIPKTTLRNITLTLQKHYETLRNCVMLGNRRDKQVREQEDIGVSSAYADDWAK